MSYNYTHNTQYGQAPQYPSQQYPSQQYTPKHSSNPYLNTPYQHHQSSKVPDTLLNPSPSPHKATLIRNQSFENRLYNQDLIQLIAKIRSLEDDLINQKFKNQAIERKAIDYEKIIDNLEYEFTEQNYQIKKYQHEIELSNQKNLEILKYEQNLRIVGEEIEELNNVLIKKNKEFDAIGQKNKQLESQIQKIDEENNALKASQNLWKNEIDSICEDCQVFTEGLKQKNNRSLLSNHESRGGEQLLGQMAPNSTHFSNPKQAKAHQSSRQNSVTFNLSQSDEQMKNKLDQLRNVFASLTMELKQRESEFQGTRKQLSQNLIKEKEKFIKLEYELKLTEERQKDTTKNQDLLSSYYNQQKAQEIIQEMMRKEDEYIARIEELSQENEALKEELESMESNNEYFEKVDLEEKQSVIENLKRENALLEGTIGEQQQKLKMLEVNYENMMMEKYDEVQQEAENALKIAKRGRKIEQENYQYKIRIEELAGELSMLQKQIAILKGEYAENQGPFQEKPSQQHQEEEEEQ